MRYFDYATRNDGANGWTGIRYIGFPSVGDGTIYNKDGSTKAFYENLAWALRAVETGDWVEIFPFERGTIDPTRVVEYCENTTPCCGVPAACVDICAEGYATLTDRLLADDDESEDRDFLVTATVQIIVRAEDRVIARLIAAETLRDYIADSPYPNDVMNGLTIDDVEDLMEED
jgi:hypothetical protein